MSSLRVSSAQRDDGAAVRALLDQFCLSSTQDPSFHQRLDGNKDLILNKGCRPIFTKPTTGAPALYDLYAEGPKSIELKLSGLKLGEDMLKFYKKKSDGALKLAGILDKMYRRKKHGGAAVSELPPRLQERLVDARDRIVEEAARATEGGATEGGAGAGAASEAGMSAEAAASEAASEAGASAAGASAVSGVPMSGTSTHFGQHVPSDFTANSASTYRSFGLSVLSCFVPRNGPLLLRLHRPR